MIPADQPIWIWSGGLTLLLIALAAALFAGSEAATSRRILLQFLFRIALPITILLGVPLLLLAQIIGIEDRLGQALIAGLVIAMGWLTTAMFTEIGRSRDRAEKLRDYHKALYAEIGNALRAIWDEGQSDGYMRATVEKMKADPTFVPFIPHERHDHVFDALVEKIEVLPRQTIDAIVAYYGQIKALSIMAEDMRGSYFRGKLAQERRIAMYEDYAQMRRQAFVLGQYALELIRAFSDGGASAADQVIARVNSPGAGPSGRSAGSE